jgi:hypothetical protein
MNTLAKRPIKYQTFSQQNTPRELAAFQQVLSALQAGLLTSDQVECLRIALHMLDDTDTGANIGVATIVGNTASGLATDPAITH